MQADRALLEPLSPMARRRRLDPEPGAPPDAVVDARPVRDAGHPHEGQELRIEPPRRREIPRADKDMRNAVDLHVPSSLPPAKAGDTSPIGRGRGPRAKRIGRVRGYSASGKPRPP